MDAAAALADPLPLGSDGNGGPDADELEELDGDAALALLGGGGGGKAAGRKPGQLSRSQRRKAKEKERKAKAKEGGGDGGAGNAAAATPAAAPEATPATAAAGGGGVEVEYVEGDASAQLAALAEHEAELADYVAVFKHFATGGGAAAAADGAADGAEGDPSAGGQTDTDASEPGAGGDDGEEGGDGKAAASSAATGAGGLSNKARKRQLAVSVAGLKAAVAHPEAVEAHDVSSPDPTLLVHLKAAPNAVPVPRHWSAKRKYLQGKRGVEKPPFALPDYIAATGITKLRGADTEAADAKSLKSRTRDKFLPKMGRIEIDYATLHDAFFVHQTKPRMSRPGDLYYEGKEFEAKARAFKPGALSERLTGALGLDAPGPDGGPLPPPWLINQQRYGPPPSYPGLRVPGLNAPLPPGAVYGYQPGGWGKPPVDPYGRPLWGGDVWAVLPPAPAQLQAAAAEGGGSADGTKPRRKHWGEPPPRLAAAVAAVAAAEAAAAAAAADDGAPPPPPPPLPPSAGGGDAGDEEDEVEGLVLEKRPRGAAAAAAGVPPPPPPPGGVVTPFTAAAAGGLGGAASVGPAMSISGMSGLETPDVLDLRKRGGPGAGSVVGGADTPAGAGGAAAAGPAPALYQVLAERRTELTGGLLGTTHAYVVPSAAGTATGGGAAAAAPAAASASSSSSAVSSGAGSGVAIALNPDELAELDEAALARKFEEASAARGAGGGGDSDFSALLQEQERRQAAARKRKLEGGSGAGGAGGGSKAKKAKEFKF